MPENMIACSVCGLIARAGSCKSCPACNAAMIVYTPDGETPATGYAGPAPGDETETVRTPENIVPPEQLDFAGAGSIPDGEAEYAAGEAAGKAAAQGAELLPGDEAAPNGEGITIGGNVQGDDAQAGTADRPWGAADRDDN